jgi:hypothetical protein
MALFGSVIPSDAQGGFSFRNKIINGQFDVWQRGTSFSVSNNVNLYNADRFMTEGYGHTYTVSRQTFTAGQTDVPGYPTYYLRLASTTTVSASQYFALVQRIETPQVTTGYGTYTLSFWVRASSGTLSAAAFTYGIDGANQSSPSLTTTWQKITLTGTTSSTGNYLTMYLINFGVGKGNISVDIANVQFEYGSIATPFEKRPFGLELALCQRYYEKSYNYDEAIGTFTIGWDGTSTNGTSYAEGPGPRFKVSKRTNPTVTIYNAVSGASARMYQVSTAASITVSLRNIGFNGVGIVDYTSSGGQNSYYFHWTAEAEL